MYPIINIFGKTIGTYSLCAIVGFIITAFFAVHKAKKSGIPSEDMIINFLIAALGIVVGGHLLYAIVNFNLVIAAFECLFNQKDITSIINAFSSAFGGSVFYGGLFGSAILLRVFLSAKKSDVKDTVFGIYALSIPLFHAFGRIGCFFGGCCYGIESKFGFVIEHNPLSPALCGVRRFPVALLEAAINLLIFFVLLVIYNKEKVKSRVFCYYGIMYSIARFFIEFLRGDTERGIFYGLSSSQWVSILFFIFSVVCLTISIRNSLKASNDKQ